MPFSSGDKALIKNLYRFKKIQFSLNNGRIFEDKLQHGKCGNVTKTNFGNMQHRPWHETGRLKHTHTEENVIAVFEMVGVLTTKARNKHILQYTRYRKKRIASYRSFTAFLVGSVFCLSTRLLSNIVVFLAFVFHKMV